MGLFQKISMKATIQAEGTEWTLYQKQGALLPIFYIGYKKFCVIISYWQRIAPQKSQKKRGKSQKWQIGVFFLLVEKDWWMSLSMQHPVISLDLIIS